MAVAREWHSKNFNACTSRRLRSTHAGADSGDLAQAVLRPWQSRSHRGMASLCCLLAIGVTLAHLTSTASAASPRPATKSSCRTLVAAPEAIARQRRALTRLRKLVRREKGELARSALVSSSSQNPSLAKRRAKLRTASLAIRRIQHDLACAADAGSPAAPHTAPASEPRESTGNSVPGQPQSAPPPVLGDPWEAPTGASDTG